MPPSADDRSTLAPPGVASPPVVTSDGDGRSAPLRRMPTAALPVPARQPAIPDPARPPAPVERRLPAHQGKLGRVGDQLAGLSQDLREWVELRIELVRAEIMEQVEFRIAQAKMGVAAGLLAALGAFFLLVTLALGLGWWLGNAFWGFLIVTVLLFVAAFAASRLLKPAPPPSARPDKTA